jgi:IS30 family transposase
MSLPKMLSGANAFKISDHRHDTRQSGDMMQQRYTPLQLAKLQFASHTFTVATNVKVYFCDPQSPWRCGSNENTNGLLQLPLREPTCPAILSRIWTK